MGWWDTGHEDDLIGDGPADILTDMFRKLAADAERDGPAKPSVQELVDAIASALATDPQAIVDDVKDGEMPPIVAVLAPDSERVTGAPSDADSGLAERLRDAFKEVTLEYQDSELERKPRLTELLATVKFVLGATPEDYLSIANGAKIEELMPAAA